MRELIKYVKWLGTGLIDGRFWQYSRNFDSTTGGWLRTVGLNDAGERHWTMKLVH
jgi:hypothetical protein